MMLKTSLVYRFIILIFCLFCVPCTNAQISNNNYALLIGGLGGEEEYSEKFFNFLLDTRKAFIEYSSFPAENIILMAETIYQHEPFVNAISTVENIQTSFSNLSEKLTKEDNLCIILFGHGNYDGKNAKLNIPRQDLSEHDFAGLINTLSVNRIIFINTASSSFPFVAALSGEN